MPDGKPVFIDVGVESYTKKTFSPERYEIWTMQSQYHNLPAFGGVMERDGEELAASCVEYKLGEHKSWIQMELAGAYPDNCVESHVRRVCLEKGKGICVTDRCTGNAGTVVLSLMTCERLEFVWEEAVSDDRAPGERENQGIGAEKIANRR